MTPLKAGASGGGARAEHGGADGMGRISTYPTPDVYRNRGDFQVSRGAELKALLKGMADYLYGFAETKEERSRCEELAKGRSLSIAGLEILVDLAARSERPFVIEETMREAVVQRIAAPHRCHKTLHHIETTRQGLADPWQVRFDAETTPVIRDAAVEHCVPHLYSLRDYIDMLVRWNPTDKRHFA